MQRRTPDRPAGPLADISEFLRVDDWRGARDSIAQLQAELCPLAPELLQEYRDELQKLLLAARIGRAHLAASLVRVRVAARFSCHGDAA